MGDLRSESPRRPAYLQVSDHAGEEGVDLCTLVGRQRFVERAPLLGRPPVAKAVDLLVEMSDHGQLCFIQLLRRGPCEQSLRPADLDLYLAAVLPRLVAVPERQRMIEVCRSRRALPAVVGDAERKTIGPR